MYRLRVYETKHGRPVIGPMDMGVGSLFVSDRGILYKVSPRDRATNGTGPHPHSKWRRISLTPHVLCQTKEFALPWFMYISTLIEKGVQREHDKEPNRPILFAMFVAGECIGATAAFLARRLGNVGAGRRFGRRQCHYLIARSAFANRALLRPWGGGFWPAVWPGAGSLLAVVAAIVVETVELSWASWIGSRSASFDEAGTLRKMPFSTATPSQ
jgi:hypothetical protein